MQYLPNLYLHQQQPTPSTITNGTTQPVVKLCGAICISLSSEAALGPNLRKPRPLFYSTI